MRDPSLPLDLVPAPADAPDVDTIANMAPEIVAGRTTWRIENTGAAEWAMAQFATAAATLAQLTEQRDAWYARIDEWFAAATRPVKATADFFRFHLESFAIETRENSPRDKKGEPTVKTLGLVTGRVATRGKAEHVDVQFEADVIEWAKSTTAALTEADALLVGAVTDVDGTFTVHVPTWVDHAGQTLYLVPLADLGVVKVKESIAVDVLRRYVSIVDHDVAPAGSDDPMLVRVAIGPDGARVPGLVVIPPDTSATVTPAV